MKLVRNLRQAVAVALLAAASQGAVAQQGVQIGVIECTVVPGSRLNLLVRSTADVTCSFNNQGTIEKYKGETGIALGLDLSIKDNEKISFTVFGAVDDVKPGSHALRGKYVGGEVSAAAGVGLGAKALVGGSNKNISLQPLAVETSTGIGLSGGLGFLYLEPAM